MLNRLDTRIQGLDESQADDVLDQLVVSSRAAREHSNLAAEVIENKVKLLINMNERFWKCTAGLPDDMPLRVGRQMQNGLHCLP